MKMKLFYNLQADLSIRDLFYSKFMLVIENRKLKGAGVLAGEALENSYNFYNVKIHVREIEFKNLKILCNFEQFRRSRKISSKVE